ncbi:mechanosensitive ion channel family protein [Kroppenstedtia sanguinis]|uniref:Mechanosensitive ion channel family protein n=1 Tax=Kroppenstedtia sanguinis TaxID=1380684 RepID=A0ABW4C556_9BACL
MEWLKSLATAGIIILISIAVYGVVKSVITRLIERRMAAGNSSQPRVDTLRTLVTSLIGYIIFFIALVAVLEEFHVNATGLIASAGILGLAIGFGAQGLVSDVVTGFFVLLENQVNVGEYVTVNNFSGVVEETGLRVLKVRGFNGDLHFIPNREINSLTNHSRGNMQALVDLTVDYKENVDEVIRLLQEECDRIGERMSDIIEGPNVLGIQSVGTSDIVIRILAKTKNGEQWKVERELRKELKKTLDEAGLISPDSPAEIHQNFTFY